MSDTHVLAIRPDGTLVAIYSDDLLPLLRQSQSIDTRRASHVEPALSGAGWTADMSPVNGPLLEGFESRTAALDAERTYIEDHIL